MKVVNKNTAYFVHVLHKSASMFLFRFFKDLSARKGINFYSPNNRHYKLPTHLDIPRDTNQSFCLSPIRSFDLTGYGLGESPDEPAGHWSRKALGDCGHRDFPFIHKQKHLIQLRDPRDILVSSYFSAAYIHPKFLKYTEEEFAQYRKKIQETDINDYVLEKSDLLVKRYAAMPQDINDLITIVEYEDMVLNFGSWAKCCLTFMDCYSEEILKEIKEFYKNEFRVPSGGMHHKRKITPGDHKQKLKTETIHQLNEMFNQFPFLNYNFEK